MNDRRVALAVCGCGALVAVLAWAVPGAYRSLPMHSPDSATYLNWHVSRPPLYPMFLSAVTFFDRNLSSLGALQLTILVAAAAWLAVTFRRFTGNPLLATGLGISAIAHPQVVSYAFTVLAETLLTSTVMVHLAVLLNLIRHPSVGWAVAAGLTLAVALLLKPAALGFAGGLVLVAIHLRHVPRRFILASVCVVMLALPLAAASFFNLARVGVFAPQAMGGYALLGVAGMIAPDEVALAPQELRRPLMEQVGPIRDELAQVESLTMYYLLSSQSYHYATDRATAVILRHLGDGELARTATPEGFARLNDVGQEFFSMSMRAAPRAYAHHIAAHLYGLWLMPLIQPASGRREFAAELERLHRTLPIVAQGPFTYRVVPDVAYWPYKALLVAALAGSLLAPLVFVVRGDRRWAPAAVASVMLHGFFLLTAAAQTGLPRYALTAWPLTVTVLWGVIAALHHGAPGARGDIIRAPSPAPPRNSRDSSIAAIGETLDSRDRQHVAGASRRRGEADRQPTPRSGEHRYRPCRARVRRGPAVRDAGTARLLHERPGFFEVETTADGTQLLVLTERFHSGWKATIDGVAANVIRVYGDYLGCVIAPGQHRIVLTFTPESVRVGLRMTLAGLAVTLVATLLLARERRRRPQVKVP